MTSVRENLIAAKALIDTPEKWGKGYGITPPTNCLCAESACAEAAGSLQLLKMLSWEALEAALPEPWRTRSIEEDMAAHHFNDHPDTTHADIMALFDRAIAAQEPTND